MIYREGFYPLYIRDLFLRSFEMMDFKQFRKMKIQEKIKEARHLLMFGHPGLKAKHGIETEEDIENYKKMLSEKENNEWLKLQFGLEVKKNG